MESSPRPSPSPTLPARRRRIHPLRWPIIVLTFPFSLLVFVLQSVFGWLPSARLVSRRGLRRLFVAVAVSWLVLGQLTMMTDRDSALVAENPRVLESWPFTRETSSEPAKIHWQAIRSCSLVIRQQSDIAFGGWPLGRPFMFFTSCSGELGASMLASVGLHSWADRWENLVDIALYEWLFHGRMGTAYLVLGFGFYVQIVVLVPWLLYVLVFNIVTRLRWES